MKKIIWAVLAFALIPVPSRAEKWATATFHTSQPIDQVFEPTAELIANKEWYWGTRWHIRSSNRALGTIQVATVSFGQQWGDIYVSIATEGTGTSIQAVMTLYSGAHLHPADYALRFAKGLKKIFPDLTYDIKRDVVPENFAYGVAPISIPLVAATTTVVQPMQSSTGSQGTIPISPAQVNSIDNSLQNIAASFSQQTTGMTPFTATSVIPMQNYAPAQMQQMGQATQNLSSSLMAMAEQISMQTGIEAARNQQRVDEATTNNAVTHFLSNANQMMGRYLATSGSEAAGQFKSTAQAITKARDDAYITLTDPTQKNIFNRATNEFMLDIEKQMSNHIGQETSANRVRDIDEGQYTDNLHRALDSWYANGKDWQKIPPEMWAKLSERDKGRLKDGIDPETINIRTPHPDHSPQP